MRLVASVLVFFFSFIIYFFFHPASSGTANRLKEFYVVITIFNKINNGSGGPNAERLKEMKSDMATANGRGK